MRYIKDWIIEHEVQLEALGNVVPINVRQIMESVQQGTKLPDLETVLCEILDEDLDNWIDAVEVDWIDEAEIDGGKS